MLQSQLIELIRQIEDENLLSKYLLDMEGAINGQKHVFQHLADSQKQVQDLKEQLDKLYSIISFDLGSPLKSLKSMIDLVQLDVENIENPLVSESVSYLNLQMEKLLFQMSNLLEWSSLQVKNFSLKIDDFDIQKVIDEVLAFYEKQAIQKGVSISKEIHEANMPLAQGDKRMIQQAISNFVSNAVKFCRKGDAVVLGAKVIDSKISVHIKDTGIGMGKAKIQNLFNPSRKSTQKGTANESGLGLGMITAKAILDLHQSPIQIWSEQGKGTEISFDLSASKPVISN
ncbi:sensor histidine kinase [Thermoflexibacter ruber]|uniref:histidine kinase n=1 Tax=Thermoflexibacter ruber TaxID=1003 RepID=A0A1I2HU19_9BACT|nr:HAMP domain-containing sensor histidine kinase [Thermoflexibacter ruber]SFF32893.1 Signal transduction histidine kinase [Thermoflexibacter ruber]